MDTLRVVNQPPCTDRECWEGGKAEDCTECQYQKDHPNVIVLDTAQQKAA